MLTLQLLGGHHANTGGEALRWRNRKSLALLALLAVAPGRCSKEWLAAVLWEDGARTQARVNLRNLAFHTRRSLGPDAAVLQDRGYDFSLERGGYRSDVTEFLELSERPESASQALQVYGGELLAGFDLPDNVAFEEWTTAERDRLHRTYVRTIRVAYERARLAGDAEQAVALSRSWIAAEPYDEPARRSLIRSLLRAGDRAVAIAAYHEWEVKVRSELGAAPAAATLDLFRRIPQAPTQPAVLPRPLPLFRPALAGRDDDLAWLETNAEIADGSRLLLIQGEPGVGRSRLLRGFAARQTAGARAVLFGRTLPAAVLPLQSLADAVRAWLSGSPEGLDEVLQDVAGIDLAELARLIPQLRSLASDLPPPIPGWPSEVDRRLALAITTLLAGIQAQAGRRQQQLVLCIDDLERSERPALDAIAGFLLQVAPSVVIATSGDEEPAVLVDWLQHLDALVEIRRRRLSRLAPSETRLLLQSMARPGPQPLLDPLATALHARSGGLPKRTVAQVRDLFDQGDLHLAADGAWGLPAGAEFSKQADLAASLEQMLDRSSRRLGHARIEPVG